MANGKPGPDGPSEDKLIKAWTLRNVDSLTVQQVADELGVSHATAKRWIRDGRDLVSELEYLDKQRQHLDRHPIRVAGVAAMDMVRSWMVEYRDQGGDPIKAAEIVIKAEERKARLLGEAQRVDLGRTPELPAPDEDTRVAIEAYRGGVR